MHMPMAMLALDQGVQMTHVPYTGAGPAIIGLLGGQVDALSTGPATIVQHVKAGKVARARALGRRPARVAARRAEPEGAGRAGRVRAMVGHVRARGQPEPVVARLREAAKVAANDDRVKQVLVAAGSPVMYLDAPEFQRYVDADAVKMTEVVRKVGKLE